MTTYTDGTFFVSSSTGDVACAKDVTSLSEWYIDTTTDVDTLPLSLAQLEGVDRFNYCHWLGGGAIPKHTANERPIPISVRLSPVTLSVIDRMAADQGTTRTRLIIQAINTIVGREDAQ